MIDAMPKRLAYVLHEKNRHGNWRWYFRRGEGKRTRLPDVYGTDEFIAAYNAALAGGAPPKSRSTANTFAWVVERYKETAHWSKLDPVTQRRRDSIMRQVSEKVGDIPIAEFSTKIIETGRDDRAAKPEAANNFLKAIRPVFAHAKKLELIAADPTLGVKQIREQTDGFVMWTEEEVAAFEAAHQVGTRARLALDIMLYTGLRRSDVVRLGRQHIKGDVLTIRPQKTKETSGVTVTLRVLSPLAASIAATPTGALTLLVTRTGEAFTPAGFGNWFRDMCKEANVPGSAHGLRKAAATRAAEAGATTHELMSMFGWVTNDEAEHYTKAADRRRIGLAASSKLERNGSG